MLTEEQKRAIDIQAAQVIRHSWGGLNGTRVRGVIDDLRVKLVEEAWFGRPVADQLNDVRYLSHEADKASLGHLYEMAADKLETSWNAVFGGADRESVYGKDPRTRDLVDIKPPQRGRDAPELGD